MQQRLTYITLGVRDLEKMKQFYITQFGWKLMNEMEGVAFYQLNGFILSLFPADELAKDAGVRNDASGSFKSFSLAINMTSEKDVDELVNELKQKGVTVIKQPEKVFWGGYSGYVADAENNLWEIAYNPFLKMDANGSVAIHQ